MRSEDKPRELLERATVLINRLIIIAKTPSDPGTGEILYPSEMHIIEAIGKNPGINVTELAGALGISKPAVSKFVKKLEKKNLIQRFKERGNDRKVFFELLDHGRRVFDWHVQYHSRADTEIMRLMKEMSADELRTIEKFLGMIELYAEKLRTETKQRSPGKYPNSR